MTQKFVDTENPKARPTGEYAKVISNIAKDGVCPFCFENFSKYHKLPFIEKNHWIVTDNMYPYKPSKVHKLIVHKKHVTHLKEVSDEAWDELQDIFREETEKHNIEGGSLITRFGNTRFTGASVTHLHAHIVQSDPDDPSYDKAKGLTMRIG